MSPHARRAPFMQRWRRYFLHLYQYPALTLGACLLGPLLIACLWTLTVQHRQWHAQESRDLLLTARLAGRLLSEHLARMQQLAQALAQQPRVIEDVAAARREPLQEAAQLLVGMAPELEAAEIRDAHGRLLAQTQPARAPQGEIPEFIAAGGSVSSVFTSRAAHGGKIVAISHDVVHNAQRIGVVILHLKLDAIGGWLRQLRVDPQGFVYVADQRGKLVAYPFQAAPGRPKDVSDWVPIAQLASPEGHVLEFMQGEPARRWTAAVVLLQPFGWRVVAQQPSAAMLAPFLRLGIVFVALIALLAIAAFLLLRHWSRLHRKTLELVAQQAELLRASEQRHLIRRLRNAKPNGSAVHAR